LTEKKLMLSEGGSTLENVLKMFKQSFLLAVKFFLD